MKMRIGCGWAQKGQRAKSRFLRASKLPLFRIGRKLGAQSQAGDGCSANNTPLVVAGNARGGCCLENFLYYNNASFKMLGIA